MTLSPDIGYHAGNLGKADSYGSIMSGNRGTGHFGTGTYFVGNEEEICLKDSNYSKRPHEQVDFSNYHLYKPYSYHDAERLFKFLKGVNYNILHLGEARRNTLELYEENNRLKHSFHIVQFPTYYPPDWFDLDEEPTSLLGTPQYTAALAVLEEYIQKNSLSDSIAAQIQEAREDGDRYYTDAQLTAKIAWEHLDSHNPLKLFEADRDWYNLYEYYDKPLGVERAVFDHALELTKQYVEEMGGHQIKMSHYFKECPSAYFMKQLGYEGVDVRHIPEMDNTKFGSVIYDLKGKDLERARELGAKFYAQKQSLQSVIAQAEQVKVHADSVNPAPVHAQTVQSSRQL